jgi:hypothetical protein
MAQNFLLPDIAPEIYLKTWFIRGFPATQSFLLCAEQHLIADFERKTGLKSGKDVSMSTPLDGDVYTPGEISMFDTLLYVNHNWIPVSFKWKSHSGKVYKIDDEVTDCDDLDFWFDNLDAVEIHRLLYPKESLPFKFKDLSFELVVTRLSVAPELILTVKQEHQEAAAEIIAGIDKFIASYNDKSEKKDRANGVVHNWDRRIEGDTIIYSFDLGSAGLRLYKTLIPHLSKSGRFTKVELS